MQAVGITRLRAGQREQSASGDGDVSSLLYRSKARSHRFTERRETVTKSYGLIWFEAGDASIACSRGGMHANRIEMKDPLEWSRCYVDELHAAVGNYGQPMKQDASRDKQIVSALAVAPRCEATAKQEEGYR